MGRLRFGELSMKATEQGVSFYKNDQISALACVEPDDVPVIIDFLKSYLADGANRRSGFRLDLTQLRATDHQRVAVAVLTERGRFNVTALDLSLTGMLVDSEFFLGREGEMVMLDITFEGHQALLSANVVRRDECDRHVAFNFPDVMGEDGSLHPPADLSAIFYSLEALWLDESLDVKRNMQ